MDSGDEVSNLFENADELNGDFAEFRHEMRRDLAAINARLESLTTHVDMCATKADMAELRTEIRTEFRDAMLTQTRWSLAGLLTIVIAIYFRS